VSDANQITLGATSRLLNADNGVERLRFGAAQRYLFQEQQLTPDGSNGSSSGKFSDLLLFGSGHIDESWYLDSTLQYNLDLKRPARSIIAARYQPAPFQTLSATYRYTRGLSEQVDLGWQWPIYRSDVARPGSSCSGVLYGVGRTSYSMRDSRVTDTLLGLEYDAGCWILRAVAERVSTGSSQATTHFMLQLELIGLSRLGSNPLQTLKDNIPGYRLLRDEDNP
jgi:LPS-assembly protein